MATDVTRDELAAALAATGVIVKEARLLRALYPGDSVFLAAVRYPGAVAEELLAHIEAGRAAPPPPVYVCPFCGAEDDDEDVITRHIGREHA